MKDRKKIQWTTPIYKQIKNKKIKTTYRWSLRTIALVAVIGFLLLLLVL